MLSLVGLLETRVSVANFARVQRGLLPRWTWFVDYTAPGNHALLHTSVLMTFVYGVNDVGGRSEVCGHSGDIRGAADEFWACIYDSGLITLPVQGEWFTWHNCSRDARSLWKRLDRFLVNDCWLQSWPNSYYSSLNARTSDHSPLVLRGHSLFPAVSMFHFDNYLTLSSDFTATVQGVWRNNIVGTAMFAVTRKLKALKPIFRAHRQRKGDLSNNVKLAASFLETAQTLLAQDRLNTVFLHLEYCCRLILRLATKLEQHMLQQRAKLAWMKGGDQCSRILFRKVARRRASKRVFQIMNSTGDTLTDQQEVVNEFVSFYQILLGGERRARSIDLGYLRPWARHVILEEEGRQLLRRVTADEVKQAVFDIDETKAPGLDGYSSGFFKATWPVVGKEVTQAILDFIATGKLLKQVNATFLSLIPKNAFVPGRSVERKYPPGSGTLFWVQPAAPPPEVWIKGGSQEGVRYGGMGLSDRGPSEGGFAYHWRCEAVQLFQLGFADDLLLFSKADERSVHIFKRDLSVFAELSGLQVNLQKSHLIVSRSAAAVRDVLLSILDYQKGFLPLWYLGLPLLASRLSIADCKPLLLKIDSRIKGWDGIVLSFAGRVSWLSQCVSVSRFIGRWHLFCLRRLFGRLRSAFVHSFGRFQAGMPKFLGSRCVNRLRKVVSASRTFLPLTEDS
ncbi:UNVERIFIED_CONTAM: hypothetical protein Slati_1295400 [Sesamum latifolium]|uniref:Reverse transcriptase n=1 Tax=Sesamum latifolium TaxID=2727402 RepID=A0AAW2XHQ3_9LAMI